jgi:uncharacterized membrane protein YraQ (UPF0718 family)
MYIDILKKQVYGYIIIIMIGTFVPFVKDPNSTSKDSNKDSNKDSTDGKPHQIVRMYISATEFYTKVIADKKAKDKKNRRVEQVMNKGSKLTQNIAVTILLGVLQVCICVT